MKKRIIGLLLLLQITCTTWSQVVINVSTGTNAAGTAAVAAGGVDPQWTIGGSPGTLRVTPFYSPFWQPTPIAVSNAGWINQSGTIFSNPVGVHIMERAFTIVSGTSFFVFTYSVAYDDVLQQLELVPPTGPTIPLSFTVPSPAYFLPFPNTIAICTPAAGTWRIRARVNFIDNVGAFILSGYINTAACGRGTARQTDQSPATESVFADNGTDKAGKRPTAAADNALQTLTVAPNPATDMVTLELPQPATAYTMVQVTDLHGRKLKEIVWPTANRRAELQTGQLLPGAYQVTVFAKEQKLATAKLIKQ